MWTPWAIGRAALVASACAICFFILGLVLLKEARRSERRQARRSEREWREAQAREPVRLAVDLSKEGRYTGTLKQTYQPGGVVLVVQVDPPFESGHEATAALEGLSLWASCLVIPRGMHKGIVYKHQGPTLEDPRFERVSYEQGREVPVLLMRRFREGEHDFWIEVSRPAEGLAGRDCVIVGRYCRGGAGEELATRERAVGGSFLALSLLIAVWVCWRLARKRRGASS